MSSWEDRFDAVVRETERNLAQLRKKSTPEKLQKRYHEEKTKSTTKYDNYLAVGAVGINPVDSYKPANSPSNRTELWKQGDELDKLRKQVTLLQQSNTQYEQEAKSLKHQVSLLKKQTISNRKREPSAVSSTSLEIFKREIWDEMRSLKAEIAGGSSAGGACEKEVSALRKDLDSARMKQAQDFQELKNDVDNMRNRMKKLQKRYHEEKTKSTTKYDNYLAVGAVGINPVDSYKPANSPSNRTELWKQGDELDKLRKQVTLLQQSNTQYEQEAKSLKHQVSLLKKQTISNRKREPSAVSSTSLEIFKREIWDEMRSLKAEIAGGSSAGGACEKEVSALRKDLDSARMKQAQDFQELKNDVDNMRNRMMKVELMVKSVVTDCKECLRKCQRLGSEASHFSETVRLQHRSVSSQLQSVSDHCAHLPVLRSSLSDLDGRLSRELA
eukprot:sb/3464737/